MLRDSSEDGAEIWIFPGEYLRSVNQICKTKATIVSKVDSQGAMLHLRDVVCIR